MESFEFLHLKFDMSKIISDYEGEMIKPISPLQENSINKNDNEEPTFIRGKMYEIDKNMLRKYINNNYQINKKDEMEYLVELAKNSNGNIQVIYEYTSFMLEHYRELLPPYFISAWSSGKTRLNRIKLAVQVYQNGRNTYRLGGNPFTHI